MDKYIETREERTKEFLVEFEPRNEWHIQANEKSFIRNYLNGIGFKFKWNFINGLDNAYMYNDAEKKYFFKFKINYLFEGTEIKHTNKTLKIPVDNASKILGRERRINRNIQTAFKRYKTKN